MEKVKTERLYFTGKRIDYYKIFGGPGGIGGNGGNGGKGGVGANGGRVQIETLGKKDSQIDVRSSRGKDGGPGDGGVGGVGGKNGEDYDGEYHWLLTVGFSDVFPDASSSAKWKFKSRGSNGQAKSGQPGVANRNLIGRQLPEEVKKIGIDPFISDYKTYWESQTDVIKKWKGNTNFPIEIGLTPYDVGGIIDAMVVTDETFYGSNHYSVSDLLPSYEGMLKKILEHAKSLQENGELTPFCKRGLILAYTAILGKICVINRPPAGYVPHILRYLEDVISAIRSVRTISNVTDLIGRIESSNGVFKSKVTGKAADVKLLIDTLGSSVIGCDVVAQTVAALASVGKIAADIVSSSSTICAVLSLKGRPPFRPDLLSKISRIQTILKEAMKANSGRPHVAVHVDSMLKNVRNMKRKLEETGFVSVNVISWTADVSAVLNLMRIILKSCSIAKESKISLDDTIVSTINVYDRLRHYICSKEVADHISELTQPMIDNATCDKEIDDELPRLEAKIISNVILSDYFEAVKVFQQTVYPAAHFYSETWKLSRRIRHVRDLAGSAEVNLLELKSKVSGGKRTRFTDTRFLSWMYDLIYRKATQYQRPIPFYRWYEDEYPNLVSGLLKGKTMILNSFIDVKGNRGWSIWGGFKTNLVELKIFSEDKAIQADLEYDMVDWKVMVSMTHMGNSYYPCSYSNWYVMERESMTIEHSFEKDKYGTPFQANEVYWKLKNGDFVLSPYAVWIVNLTSPRNLEKLLDKYKDKIGEIGVFLEGCGQSADMILCYDVNINDYYTPYANPLKL